jgi:predicted TIM-barrel fold metal-dependent hydrolase
MVERCRSGRVIGPSLLAVLAGCTAFPSSARHYEGPVIDAHVHLEREAHTVSPDRDATMSSVERSLSEAHIAAAGLVVIAPKGDMAATRARNDMVSAAVKKAPKRFFAFGSVHPDDGEAAVIELERMAKIGIRGLKLHPNTQNFDVASPSVDRIVQKAGELKLVILFDGYSPFDANETGKFIVLAVAHPQAKIIVAHMGGPRFLDMLGFFVLKSYPTIYKRNVWFDLSGVAHMIAGSPSLAEQLRHTCRLLGIDRILFGSDFPLVLPSEAVGEVRELGFGPEEERKIFHDNAAELFNLPVPEPRPR